MWMMGYNDNTDFHIPDSFSGRKLRPIVPRPLISPTTNSSTRPPCLNLIHGTDFLAVNHLAEQNKREFSSQPVVVSSRWNPTPEQLRTLEELYRRGTRTPSADQIQHITSQLRRYGKIEGKNVFYWFQNHKARERQKRRRQRESAPDNQQSINNNKETETGTERTRYQAQQNKNWPHSINCSTLSEKEGGGGGKGGGECIRTDGWIEFEEEELQQRRNFVQGNDTWQMIQLSCLSHTHLLNTEKMDPSLVKSPDLDIFMAPCREIGANQFTNSDSSSEDGYGETQTLQLFPLEKQQDDENEDMNQKKKNNNFTTCYQFFEFLPLKN